MYRPRFRMSLPGFVIGLMLLPGVLRAQDRADAAYQEANRLMMDEKWPEAAAAFEAYLSAYPRSRRADDAAFWRCYALEKQAPVSEDVYDCYEQFIARHRRSAYVDDARGNLIAVGQRLAKAGHPGYAERIRSMKQSGEDEVTLAALYALQDIGDEEALGTLLEVLDGSGEKVRKRIVYMLADFDAGEVLERLTSIALNDPSVEVRRSAVYALGNREDDPGLGAALDRILTTSTDPEVRKAALYAMANAETPGVAEAMKAVALSDGDRELAVAATYALGNLETEAAGKALLAILQKAAFKDARRAALYAIGNREDPESLSVLIDLLPDLDEPELQKAALYAISNREEDSATEALLSVYGQFDDPSLKKALIYALGNRGGEKVLSFLKSKATGGEDPELAKAAVYALSDREVGMDFWVEVIRNSPSREVRGAAIHKIGESEDPEGVRVLGKLLSEEKDPDVRRQAVYALGEREGDDVVPVLVEVIKNDASTRVRTAAVQALGNIGTPRAKAALLEILKGGGEK